VDIANAVETVRDSRIPIELINSEQAAHLNSSSRLRKLAENNQIDIPA
jgi:hypothetical protein